MTRLPLRVLLVQGERAEADRFDQILRQADPSSAVVSHSRGLEGTETQLARGDVDVVVLDLGPPDAAGLDTLARACAICREVPVVVLIGRDDDTRAQAALELGAEDYLVKAPWPPDVLAHVLRHAAERRRLGESLRVRAELYRSIVDTSVEGVVIHQDAVICFANDAAARLLGHEHARELVGRQVADLTAPEDREAVVARLEACARGGSVPARYEFRGRRRDDARIWIGGLASVTAWRGRPATICTMVDVTERKRAEETAGALAEIGREMAGTLGLVEVTNTILSRVLALFDARMVTMYRMGAKPGTLVCVGAHGKRDPQAWVGRTLRIGEGITGRAVAEGQPVWTSDMYADSRITVPESHRDLMEPEDFRSGLAIPLNSNGQVVGALFIGGARPGHAFSADDLGVLSAFGDQAALAVGNAALFDRAAQRAAKLAVLARVASLITSVTNQDEVFDAVARAAIRLLGARAAQVLVDDPVACVLRAPTGSGLDPTGTWPAREPTVIAHGTGVAGTVLASRVPAFVEDVQEDPRWLERGTLREDDFHAYAGLPLIARERVLGVLSILFAKRRVFTREEIELMTLLADQAAIAIDNARLYQEVRAARDFLQSIAESSAEAIITTDIRGHITYWSPGAEEILGYRSAEMLGRPVAALYRSGFDEAHRVMERLRRESRIPDYETSMRAKDGTWHEVGGAFSLLRDTRGAITGTLGVMRDIAERQRLEESLRQAQKMEAVGRLAGGIAHDFNNLMTVIVGGSDLLLGRLRPEDPLRHDIALFKRMAERAAALTHQLLAFGRKQVLQPTILDLNAVVADMDSMLRRLIGEDIELACVLGPDPLWIKADRGQLEQVIANLAVNARDAMAEGGRLTIETARREFDEAYVRAHGGTGPWVMLAVIDTGAGMDQATQARIFEPFFTTKDQGRGTGLGLSTVYGIVKQSGGHISVHSAPGQGTTFRISLPRAEGAGRSVAPRADPPDDRGHGETILLVEDEREVRSVVRQMLERDHYVVLEAESADDALGIVHAHPRPIHLLLTDVIMPGLSGPELARHVRERRPDTRILFMSGYTDDVILHHGGRDAGTAFLEKPFTSTELGLKIQHVLTPALA